MLRSLRPGSSEGWVSIPDPPSNVLSFCDTGVPSFCCVEDVLFGGAHEIGYESDGIEEIILTASDELLAFDLSTRTWETRKQLRFTQGCYNSTSIQLAGRLYIGGQDQLSPVILAEVKSYDPRTDQWRSESPLPLGKYGAGYSRSASLRAVAHEGQVVVIGIEGVPPLVLVGDVWTELPPLPLTSDSFIASADVSAASLRLR